MNKKLVFFSLSLVFINGCALGVRDINPEFSYENKLVNQNSLTESAKIEIEPGITVSTKWIGNAYPLATGKSLLGLNNRYVIPYTRLTTLMSFRVENNSEHLIRISPKNITLSSVDSEHNIKENPLSLSFFKNRWPVDAVKSQDMLIDQSVAIGEVIRTIFQERIIEPSSSYEAYLAFKKLPENLPDANLKVIITVGQTNKNISFDFVRK